ncbi:MAG: hypothetical protein E7099_08795 [Mediterranea massiliensis]|nr:hypothetical protein [Mediterranea massiliensis]
MAKLSYKISYYVLYAMFAVIVAVIALFFMGGDAQGEAVIAGLDPAIWQPAQTDAMLFLMYALVAFAIIATLVGVLAQFATAFKDSPVNALKSLVGIILLVVVLLVSWSIGSEETLTIPGYDGTQNEPFWLKLSDMFIYTIYILIVGTVLSMLFGVIKKKLS